MPLAAQLGSTPHCLDQLLQRGRALESFVASSGAWPPVLMIGDDELADSFEQYFRQIVVDPIGREANDLEPSSSSELWQLAGTSARENWNVPDNITRRVVAVRIPDLPRDLGELK